MHPTSPKLLSDVLKFTDSIQRVTAGKFLDDYLRDDLLRAGVERWFENIGEALRRLERKDPGTAAKIPEMREMIDFRNLLAHGYNIVRDEQVWPYVKTELPPLRPAVADLIASSDRSLQTE